MSQRTSRKLATWTIAASVVLLGVGAAGAWYAHVLRGRVSWALADNVTSIRAALKIQLVLREEQSALERFNISRDVADLRQALRLEPAIKQAAAEVTRFASTEYEYGIVGKMNEGLKRFFSRLHESADPLIAEKAAPPSTSGHERKLKQFDVDLLARYVLPSVTASLDFNEQELAERSRENETMASRLVLALIVFGVCGAVGGAALGYGLARGIRRKVYELSVPLRDVAGQLNQVVGPVTIDEDPAIDDLEGMLKRIAGEVGAVVEKLHATHRQVLRADQLAALGQLAAGLAHELHNPLMSIKILVQSARADGSPLAGSDLRVLDEEIMRLQELLQSFLNFARPAKLQRKSVDLRATISQTVAFISSRAARRKIAIRACLPKRPVSINADEAQVRQVLLNLLLNALDSVAEKGTIWVDVGPGSKLSPSDPSQQTLLRGVFVAVADNGRGLPAANIERIFEPFFSTKETGLGLGLAICRQIVESHGGSIDVERGPNGVGAAFRVFLPQSPLPTADPPSVEAAALPALEHAGEIHA